MDNIDCKGNDRSKTTVEDENDVGEIITKR